MIVAETATPCPPRSFSSWYGIGFPLWPVKLRPRSTRTRSGSRTERQLGVRPPSRTATYTPSPRALVFSRSITSRYHVWSIGVVGPPAANLSVSAVGSRTESARTPLTKSRPRTAAIRPWGRVPETTGKFLKARDDLRRRRPAQVHEDRAPHVLRHDRRREDAEDHGRQDEGQQSRSNPFH